MTKALITGVTGFVGSHLAEYLLFKQNVEVYGFDRYRSRTENIEHLGADIRLSTADICDYNSVFKLIKDIKPDYIFHLAAMSFVQQSFICPDECRRVNVGGTENILRANLESGVGAIVHIASSSECYGLVKPDEVPITECNDLRPQSPYGESKIAAENIACRYYKNYGLPVVITRAFNHTGARRNECFAESTFAKQIAETEAGRRSPVIRHGNLDARRDYTDVRDMVRAYWLAANKCKYGEVYNICSGKTWQMVDVLMMLTDMSKVKFSFETDQARMRPSEVPLLLGDCTKFKEKTGWQPEIPFNETLTDLLNYWRSEHLQPAA